ncbi:hypothetical protein [Candidatus Nitrosotenuis uzonensis]|uniref:Uncharacterized protein n=1 Tax=Candidatus Nitrosotenuis uzonensis TaxID=1407055 RepID=V6ASQ4_9ARCH|nr:hypothetical protein [Candidatus Nitrosotenuis uzonensis]CDI05483.1 exported hypothetical protein [Candidatus Nitrosotenuis uzonensis]
MRLFALTAAIILVLSIGIIPPHSVEAAKDEILSKDRQEKAKDEMKEKKIKSKIDGAPKNIEKICSKKIDSKSSTYSQTLKKIQKLFC